MERTSKQARRAGMALAAAVALAFGAGAAQAQTFGSADIDVISVGFLQCSFKVSGLQPNQSVEYTCGAADVGWLTQCFVKNKPIANIAPALHVAHDVITTQELFASKRGTLTAAMLTAYPTVEQEFEEPLCPEVEGVEVTEQITAIRWCEASLTAGGAEVTTESELFLQMVRNGAGNVPSCAVLANTPAIP